MSRTNADRRRFLRTAATGALVGSALDALPALGQVPPAPQVLIIGAGMSGIAASYWLRQYGIRSLVLEGRDRLGGRLWTSRRWPDAPLDMGGAWVHGTPTSPLTPLLKQFSVKAQVVDFFKVALYRPTGASLTAAETAEVGALVGALTGKVEAQRQLLLRLNQPDRSLGSVLDPTLAAMKVPPPQLTGMNALLNFAIRLRGADPSGLSLFYFEQDENYVDPTDVAFPGGFVQLVEKLAQGQQILYGQVVKQIQYNAQGVTVVTQQGTFSAPYAIVTLPIGVLKSGRVDFKPMLPAWKRGAIDRLRMGRVDKLVLRFARPFWDIRQTFLLRALPDIDQFSWWFNAAGLTGQPILVAFITSHLAQQIETLPDAEVIRRMLVALRQWFGAANVPEPIAFQRSQWGLDPFALGCYPHKPPGATSADYDFMSLPVPYAPGLPASANRLFFAGDGTHRAHPTSAWGAYESGKREAQRLKLLLRGLPCRTGQIE